MNNKIFVKPEITEKIRKKSSIKTTGKNVLSTNILTNRELQVFESIGQGISTKKTAQLLNVSIKTIESHRRHIKDKFNLYSGIELTRSAILWYLEKNQAK